MNYLKCSSMPADLIIESNVPSAGLSYDRAQQRVYRFLCSDKPDGFLFDDQEKSHAMSVS